MKKRTEFYRQARAAADPDDRAVIDARFDPAAQRSSCKACGSVTALDFQVSPEIWSAAVPEAWRDLVLCLDCFDALAAVRGVDYRQGMARYPLHFAGDRVTFVLRVIDKSQEG